MTKDAFQEKYHNFHTKDKMIAEKECLKVNKEGIEGSQCVVACFDGNYCLMLESASDYIKELGL